MNAYRRVVLVLSVTCTACASHPPARSGTPPAAKRADDRIATRDDPDLCPEVPEEQDASLDIDGCPEPEKPAAIGELTFPATACELMTDRWEGTEPITELRLSADGPVYALATRPQARLHLAVGPSSAGAAVEFDDSGVVLHGFLKSGTFEIHPKRPIVFGGFAVPLSFAVLSYSEVRETEISVNFDIGPGVEGLAQPLGANLPCSDLAVEFTSFEAPEAFGDLSKAPDAQLRLGHPIALRLQPGSKVVAQLRAKDDDDSVVKVIGSAGGSKRIVWWRDNGLVFGWVAASELRPRTVALTGYGTGHGRPALPTSDKVLEVLRCYRDLALVAEADGYRVKVGELESGVAFDVLARAHDFVSIQPQSRNIAPAPNAKLLVSAQEVASCAPIENGTGQK